MFSFTAAQTETFLSALRTYEKSDGSLCKGHRTCTIARIWSLLADARFLNLHGHEAARMDCDQVIGPPREEGWVLRLLQMFSCFLLFNTPNVHHMRLKRLWLGRVVVSVQWEKFINGLLDEWSETSLLAGVLLTADVSFWSVSNPDFWTELGIWISAVFALGSIVTAILQSRQHRGRVLAPAIDVANYMASVESRSLALLPLAINYALPYVLFMWSVTFLGVGLVAFARYTFWQHTSGRIAIIYMGAMGILPVAFSACFVWNIRLRGLAPAWARVANPSNYPFKWTWPVNESTPNDSTGPPQARSATVPTGRGDHFSAVSTRASSLQAQWKRTLHLANSLRGSGDIEAQGGSQPNLTRQRP